MSGIENVLRPPEPFVLVHANMRVKIGELPEKRVSILSLIEIPEPGHGLEAFPGFSLAATLLRQNVTPR